jgi:hypothetical protein
MKTARSGRQLGQTIRRVLDEVLTPAVLAAGFTGQAPHYQLHSPEAWALLDLYVDKWGGGFRIELGIIPPWAHSLAGWGIPRDPKRMTAMHPPASLRLSLPRDFIHYGGVPVDEWPILASRATRLFVRRGIPWLTRNLKALGRLETNLGGTALTRLARQYPWVDHWASLNATSPGCRDYFRQQFKRARDKTHKILAAWALGKSNDREALDYLARMLDDPAVVTRYRSDPGESIRAAQALCDIHGWRFRWGTAAVAATKRRLKQTTERRVR